MTATIMSDRPHSTYKGAAHLRGGVSLASRETMISVATRLAAVGVCLGLGVLACGSGSLKSDGGSSGGATAGTGGGGSAGTGGQLSACTLSGSGAGGAGGSSVVKDWMDLGCLRDLVAPCTCGYDTTSEASACGACYPPGVMVSTAQQTSCGVVDGGVVGNESLTITTVRRPDGSVCFTVEESCLCNQLCEFVSSTFKNPAGQVVARGSHGLTRPSLHCETTGETCGGGTAGIGGGLSERCQVAIQMSCPQGSCR